MSELGKEAGQSTLSSQSSDNEDMYKEEEEGGDVPDPEEPWGGLVEDDVLPPVSSWFGMVAKLLKVLIPNWSQDMEV